jgi:hypothetical protein
MGTKLVLAAGVLLILLGAYGIFRPNLLMPGKRQDLQIGGQRVVMETRRVVEVPRPLSGLVIFSGIGLVLLGLQKR